MMIFVRLFFEFFKAGLFAIGGGMATLPFLYNISDKTGWFTYGQLADMVAISESTPGPMGVNMATYVGFTTAGPAGAVIATLGLITPSIIVILIIAGFLKSFKTNKYVQNAFSGINRSDRGSRTFRSVLGSSSQGRFCGKRKDHRPDQHPQYRSSCSALLFHGSLQKDERTPSGCVYCGICGDRSCVSVRRSLKFKKICACGSVPAGFFLPKNRLKKLAGTACSRMFFDTKL